jgi:hypothetical protein
MIDLPYNVVSVSVREDVLWAGIEPPYPQDDRLRDFFAICQAVVAWRQPLAILIGSEPAWPEEMVEKRAPVCFVTSPIGDQGRLDHVVLSVFGGRLTRA